MVADLSRRAFVAMAMAGGMLAPGAGVAGPPSRFRLPAGEGRDTEIWHWSTRGKRVGTVAFSHGALSAPWKYDRVILPWVAAGYDVLAPWHVDSRDHPLTRDYPGLATWKARIEDMHALARHIGIPHVTCGHSYGALTALVMGGAQGEVPDGFAGPLRDPLTRCVVALSPPPPIPGLITEAGYASLAVPALIQTGDHDVMPGAADTPDAWHAHRIAYDAAAPGGSRYLLVLAGVDHYFGSAICEPTRPAPPQLAQLGQAVAISRLFLQAYWQPADASARRALDARRADAGPVILERK